MLQISGENLIIEVTESTVLKDERAAIFQLRRFASLGIQIALDDFGRGYSSLRLLQNLPLDILKIEKGFIEQEFSEFGGKELLKSIISIARDFNLKSVACGLEEEELVDFFSRTDCDYVQGYYFSRPVPAESAGQLLETWHHHLES